MELPDFIDNCISARLTKYSREEILRAAQEYTTAVSELRAIIQEAWTTIQVTLPEGCLAVPLWEHHLRDREASIYDAVCLGTTW